MKKIELFFLCLTFVFCMLLNACSSESEQSKNPFPINVTREELLYESKEDYNSVQIYQQKGQLVINAKSEAGFFDGAQFTVKTVEPLTDKDVAVIWTTVGGGTEKTEKNDRIISEIVVRDNETIIFDKKINFVSKAIHAVEDLLEKRSK